MKSLLVEDEFIARMVMNEFLNKFSHCDIAVDGNDGYAALLVIAAQAGQFRSHMLHERAVVADEHHHIGGCAVAQRVHLLVGIG